MILIESIDDIDDSVYVRGVLTTATGMADAHISVQVRRFKSQFGNGQWSNIMYDRYRLVKETILIHSAFFALKELQNESCIF